MLRNFLLLLDAYYSFLSIFVGCFNFKLLFLNVLYFFVWVGDCWLVFVILTNTHNVQSILIFVERTEL